MTVLSWKPQYTGNYTSQATGLLINTRYYYQAYIQTDIDVYYGDVFEFTTLKDDAVVVRKDLRCTSLPTCPKPTNGQDRYPDLTVSNGVTYNTSNKPSTF